MLTEKRYEIILSLLRKQTSISVPEIKEVLSVSEATIRRDLTALDRAGKLVKVFGGAVATERAASSLEPSVAEKMAMNREEKQKIARYAAGLIAAGDLVYLDAGTTTGAMIEFITEKSAVFVTNAVEHAKRLAAGGFRVLLIGGELKGTTEAVVGNEAVLTIQNYHFNKGFFGANGVSIKAGCTTPDYNEALVKRTAFENCGVRYVLCDSSKFGNVGSVTFAAMEAAEIITDRQPEGGHLNCRNLIVVPNIC